MPFVFLFLGMLLLVTAIRGTQGDLFALLKSEFVGKSSFFPWAAAIIILGAIGYIRPIRPISDALIGLVILVIILANKGGVFAQFNTALSAPVTPSAPVSNTAVAPAPADGSTAFSVGQGLDWLNSTARYGSPAGLLAAPALNLFGH
jgi:hypothetical protein